MSWSTQTLTTSILLSNKNSGVVLRLEAPLSLMQSLEDILEKLGLSEYLPGLLQEGFTKWETVLDITESDLEALNFKRGHRRILQREIASFRGISPSRKNSPFIGLYSEESVESQASESKSGKRKYRHHPKQDGNAPEKPPSAYVMFANDVRQELKAQNEPTLSFTEIARLVGEKWKALPLEQRSAYETQAATMKDQYTARFAEYKKTDAFREYQDYVAQFRLKYPKEQGSTLKPALTEQSSMNSDTDAFYGRKRPRLQEMPSTGSNDSSTDATSPVQTDQVVSIGRHRAGSNSMSISGQSQFSAPSALTSMASLHSSLSHPSYPGKPARPASLGSDSPKEALKGTAFEDGAKHGSNRSPPTNVVRGHTIIPATQVPPTNSSTLGAGSSYGAVHAGAGPRPLMPLSASTPPYVSGTDSDDPTRPHRTLPIVLPPPSGLPSLTPTPTQPFYPEPNRSWAHPGPSHPPEWGARGPPAPSPSITSYAASSGPDPTETAKPLVHAPPSFSILLEAGERVAREDSVLMKKDDSPKS